MSQCPRCKNQVDSTYPVETSLVDKLAQSEGVAYTTLCKPCLMECRKGSSEGNILALQALAKEKYRAGLWRSRLHLLKKGRSLMEQKKFQEAALHYEKYLRLMEIVFDVQKGTLSPDHFKEKARTTELTVISSVYWDLMRIYDTSLSYADRQQNAAKQLAKFVPYTPIFPDIVRKAQAFTKKAKNPAAIKTFINLALKKKAQCFIASSAFESSRSEEVLFLRAYRDGVLKKTFLGRQFIFLYYKISPSIACILDKQTTLKPFARAAIRLLISCVR